MVAIVAGNGRGLLNTSLNTVGAAGVLGQGVLGQGSIRAMINAVNGNLVLQSQDAQLAGRGTDLFALRTYNSLSEPTDGDEDGWRWACEQIVRFQGPGTPLHPAAAATVVRTAGDGHETAYTWDAARAAFVTNEGSGAHDELTYDGAATEWVWTDGSLRVTEQYSNSSGPAMTGRLVRSTDTSNNSIDLTYDHGRLTLIRDSASQQELRLSYSQFNGLTRPRRLEALPLAEDANGHPTSTLGDPLLLVEYDYDSQGRLTTVTRFLAPSDGGAPAGAGFATSYGYKDSSNRIASVTQSDGTTLSFTYDAAGRVSAVTDQSGAPDAQLAFAYDAQPNSTTVTDGNGRVWTYRHDGLEGRLIEFLTPQVGNSSLSTKFQYDTAGNLEGTTDPQNNAVIYRYDAAGNPEFVRDAAGNMTTRTFNSLNQVVTETSYRIADPDGDGPQDAADPVTTRYVYDAASRLRFLVSAEGRVTENRYGSETNGFGLLTQTLLYVGQLYDVTGLGSAQQLTETELMDWVADLPDMTQVQLTEYSYDLRGNISQQTSYATVSAAGAGVLDEQASVNEYVYDAHSGLKKRIAVKGSARTVVSSFTYDGIMRVLTSSGPNGSQTTVYDDSHSRVTMTTASGLMETREHDSRGRLVSVSQEDGSSSSTIRRTRYVYDNADRLRMVEDAQGGRRYSFYDAAGRLEFNVDAIGAVTRFEHNAAGLLLRQTRYLSRADAANWYDSATDTVTKASLTVGAVGSDVIVDATYDRVTTFDYDRAGRLTASTDAIGTVTAITYDGLSRVVMTQNGDRVTRYLYDKDNRRVGIVDALGYFTEYKYDAGGRLVETVRYSQRSPAAANISAPVWIGATQQTVVPGRPFRYRLAAYDADGDPVVFSAVGALPAWVSFDADTATLHGSPPTTATSDTITLRVDDGRGAAAADVKICLTVIAALPAAGQGVGGPDWELLSPLDIIANAPVSYVVPGAVGGPSLTYRVVGGLPAGLSFDSATRSLTGSTSAVGFYSILLQATEAGGQSTDRTLSVRIRTAAMSLAQTTGSDQPSAWRPADGRGLRSYLYYDGQGRVVGAVDEQQFLTETVYDEALNTRRILRYLLPVVVAAADTLTSLRSRAGIALTISLVRYDGFGRIHEVTGLDGSTLTRNDYDEAGCLTRVVTAVGTNEERARRSFYNAFGEVTATLGSEGDAWLGTNPTPQRIEQAIREYGVRNEYDTLGRQVHSIDANRNLTIFYYDLENRRTHSVNVLGQAADNSLVGEVSETLYNSFSQPELVRRYAARLGNADMDQLLAAADGGGGGLADKTLLGKLATLADASLDQVSLYEYDRCGRLVRQVDAESGFTENIYNAFGEVIARVRSTREGQTTTSQFDYDLLGRIVSQTDDVGCINANTRTDYDAFGRVVRTIDAMGAVTTTAYPDNGRSIVVTDPLQCETRTDYDALGRVSRVTDALGRQTVHSHDEATRSVTVTTPEGRHVTTARTRHGETLSVTDGRGNVTRYGFNRDGQPTTVIDPLGRLIAQTAYDKSGRRVEVTDARDTVTRFRYDQRNRVVERRVDPAGVNLTTLFAFDALGQQIQVTEAVGTAEERITVYRFDRKGRTKRVVLDAAASGLRLCTTYEYDHLDNIVTVALGTIATPNRHVTLYEFDNLGRRIKEIAAPSSVLGAGALGTRDLTTHYRYDASGRLTRRVDRNGRSTWQVYDAAGQLTHSISALGEVSESRYDAAGQLVYSHRYLDRLQAIILDGFGDVIDSIATHPAATPGDQRSYVVYDGDGHARFGLKATGATGWVVGENRYDANCNVIEVLAYDRFVPDARIVALDSAFSPGITVAEITEELSTLGYQDDDPVSLMGVPRTFMAYDANNRHRFTVDPMGSVTENVYDSGGNVVAAVRFAMRPAFVDYTEAAIDAAVDRSDPGNRVTHYAYDVFNRLRYTVNALGSVTENEYDSRGNIVTTVRWATRPELTHYSESAIAAALPALSTANDQVTRLIYDAANRLRFTIGATGSVTENAYDEMGNVIVKTLFAQRPALAPGSFEVASVDAALDPLRSDDENHVTRFAYDAVDRLRFTVDALASVTESVYDGNGNLLANTLFAARPILAQYDESAIAAAVAPLQSDPRNRTTHYAYDAVSRLRFTVDTLGSVTEQIYDALGNTIGIERFAWRTHHAQYSESAVDAGVARQRGGPGNRIEHHLLDALGRTRFSVLRLSVEAGGQSLYSVSGQELNALGQPVSSTAYATAVPLAEISEAAISAVVGAGDPFRDRVSRFVFDLAGRQLYRLQAVSMEANRLTYRISAQDFDSFGQVVRSTDYAAVAATLDAFEKAAVDAAVQAIGDLARDRVSVVAYDALGQPIYTVRVLRPNEHGVIKQEYNPLSRVYRTTRYANIIGPLASFDYLTIEAAVNGVTSENDRKAQYVYDAAGWQRFVLETDKTGHWTVAENRYDAFGNLIESRRYDRYVTDAWISATDSTRPAGALEEDVIGQLASLGYSDTDPASLSNMQRSLFAYDRQNRLRFTVDALGGVAENVYDALGDLMTIVRFAAQLAPAKYTEDAIAAAADRNDAGNRVHHLAYDSVGHLRFTVQVIEQNVGSGRGSKHCINERRYDALDQLVESRAYATTVGPLAAYDEATLAAALPVSDPMNDRRSAFAYDSGGRLAFLGREQGGPFNEFNHRRYRVTAKVRDKKQRITHVAIVPIPTGVSELHTVSDIIRLMNNGHEFFTIVLVNGKRNEAKVFARTHPTSGRRYLYTGPDDTNENNLEKLPNTSLLPDPMFVTKQVYDALGMLVQKIEYARWSWHISSSVPDSLNDRTTTYIRDAAGRLRFEIMPDLSFRENKYDALDQMTEAAQFDFKLLSHELRTESEMIVLRGNHAVGDDITHGQVHSFDAAGRLTSTVDALGNTERYEYDALGDRPRWTDKNGHSFDCIYDRKGRKISETSPPLKFKLRGEDLDTPAPDRVLETHLKYDAFGNLIRKIEAANFAADSVTTDYSFDTTGRPTDTFYNGFYDVVTGSVERDPGADRFKPEASIVYDTLGNPVRIGTRMGANAFQHTWKTYDSQGRVVHEINALNNVTRYTYNSFGEQETVTRYSVTVSGTPQNGMYWIPGEIDPQLVNDSGARTIQLTYDKLGRKSAVTLPTATFYSTSQESQGDYFRKNPKHVPGYWAVQDAAVTFYNYNAFGDVVLQRVVLQRVNAKTVVEWQDTSYTRDAMGRWTRSLDATGNVTVSSYDAFGNLVRHEELTGKQDGTDRITEFVYNALNQQIRIVRYGLKYTDADGVEHGAVYWTTEFGGEWRDPDAHIPTTVRSTTYDGYGRPLQVTDAAGNVTSMRYNALGQMVEVISPARLVAPLAANDENAIDPFRNQLSETLVTSMTLDPFGRAVRQQQATSQDADSRQIFQSYDAAGNLVSTMDAEGHIRLRACDAAGRVIRETQAIHSVLGPLGINEQGLERRYVYDALGQLTDTLDVYVDDTDKVQSGKSVLYNPFGEVYEERRKWGPANHDPATLKTAKVAWYHYDNVGHVFEKVAADGLTLYFYNLLGQVTREEKRGDSNHPGVNRVTELQYDVLGRAVMIRRPEFSADIGVGTKTSWSVVTPYSYRTLDRWGNVIAMEEGGYRWSSGQPVFAPIRISRSYGYDDNNKLVSENLGEFEVLMSGVSYPLLISKQLFRDLFGNVVKEVDAAQDTQSEFNTSRTRRRQYDNVGQLTAEIDATSRKVEYAYSVHGERLGTRNARGTVLFDRYDRNSNVIFHGVLRTTSATGAGEYDSHAGTGMLARTYLKSFLYDQANRRFASKTIIEGENAPWSYTWLDGRNLGVQQRDVTGIVTRYSFDPFGNKRVEIDGAGARTEWTASTANYSVGRIESFRQRGDTGATFGRYEYNDFGEVRLHWLGNTRTEYWRQNNGLVENVNIMPDTTDPNVREGITYGYDAGGRLREERVSDSVRGVWIKNHFSYDDQGRLSRVEQSTTTADRTISVVSYDYDEWSNVRRIWAKYQSRGKEPRISDSFYDYDAAGRMTVSNGWGSGNEIHLKARTPGSVGIRYDNVGRRSGTTEYVSKNSKFIPPTQVQINWDTFRNERYTYNDLGHLHRIEQQIAQTNIVEIPPTGGSRPKSDVIGRWQMQSSRNVNLRGDVTRTEQWSRISGDSSSTLANQVPDPLGTTNTSYRADGQVSWTKTDATDPKKSTETLYNYNGRTGQLDYYVFNAFRSDGVPFTTEFQYRYTLQKGQRVVRLIRDVANDYDTIKYYDNLGRLSSESAELPKPNPTGFPPGSDRYENRFYKHDAAGRIIFKRTELRLSASGSNTVPLPVPSTGQQTYVYSGDRMVGTVGTDRLDRATKFDFAYTPMSEASGSGTSRYVVQSGESLIDIAQASYGDGALWQLIADANSIVVEPGTEPGNPLPTTEVGKVYEIPDVVRSSQTASTFNPFGLAEIIGIDRPIAIPPPPPPRYSQIELLAAPLVSMTITVGVTAVLTALNVPAPLSYAIGSGLGNLGGQAVSWGLGMQAPGQEGIDWGSVQAAIFKGGVFGFAGPYGTLSMEILEQGKSGFDGWTSGPGLNWSGISGSLFNVGFDALGTVLGGPKVGPFNFGLGGLINSAYNPRSGWAIPGSGRSPVVGAFEYVYGAFVNGLAATSYTWIRKRLEQPSAPARGQPRSVDDPKGPLPADLLEQWDEEDWLYTDELDRASRVAESERISTDSNERLEGQLRLNVLKDLIEHYGEDIDDREIIRSALRQRSAERAREKTVAQAARVTRDARLRANTARIKAEEAARIAAGPDPKLAEYVRMMDEVNNQILRDLYADAVYVPVSKYVMFDGLTIEHVSGIYDTMYSRFHNDEDIDKLIREYQVARSQDPLLIGLEVVLIEDLNTTAARARRSGAAVVKNFNEFSKEYARTHDSRVGVKKAFLEYHIRQDNEIQANWDRMNRSYRTMRRIVAGTGIGVSFVFDPVGTAASLAVGWGTEKISASLPGISEEAAASLGQFAGDLTGIGIGIAQIVRSPPSVQNILRAERAAARAELNAALRATRAAEFEMNNGIRISEDVTLFKGIPAEARAARPAAYVPALLDAPGAPPRSLVLAGDAPPSSGVPALAGRDYAPYSYGVQSMLSYDAPTSAMRHLSDVALTGAFEPRSRLVANIFSGGAAEAGAFRNVIRGRATDRGVGVLWIEDASKLSSTELRDVISAVKDMDFQAGIAGGLVRRSIPERSVANRVAAIARGKKGEPGPLNLGPTQAAGHIPDAAGGGSPLGPIIGLPEKINKSWGGQWKRYEPGFTFEGFSLYDKASRQYIYPSLSLEHAPNPNITF
jgi:YD repeat-containing protein